MQELEKRITKIDRARAAEEAKARGSNKTRKVPGFKFSKRLPAFQMDRN